MVEECLMRFHQVRRELDRLLERGHRALHVTAALHRLGEVVLRRVIGREQLRRLLIPGNRGFPILHLRLRARQIELIRP